MINKLTNNKIFNFWALFTGTIIFGLWLTLITNFSKRIDINVQLIKKHDPMCIGMDNQIIPLEDCYWSD